MPSGSLAGLVLAAALGLLAVAFLLGQRRDRRRRADDLSDDDRRYFARQDSRRAIGSAVMLAAAVLIATASAINPTASRLHGRLWGLLWLGVLVLVGIMVPLALLDWASILGYAGRHRRALLMERMEALQAERARLARRGVDPFGQSNGDPV